MFMRANAVWKIKDNSSFNFEEIASFLPGGYTFTHKSGHHVSFDFNRIDISYTNNKFIECNLCELDEDFIKFSLKENKLEKLIENSYSLDFFKDGKIDLSNEKDEMYCTLDTIIKGIRKEDNINVDKYIEPVLFTINEDFDYSNKVILYNKLTKEEYDEYFK